MLEKLERKDKRRGAKGKNSARMCVANLLILSQSMLFKDFAKATEIACRKEVLPMHAPVFMLQVRSVR